MFQESDGAGYGRGGRRAAGGKFQNQGLIGSSRDVLGDEGLQNASARAEKLKFIQKGDGR